MHPSAVADMREHPATIVTGLAIISRAGVSASLTDQLHDKEGQPMQYIEIERKFRINDPDTLRSRLRELGPVLRGKCGYYNAPHRDFLDAEIVSEWLTVRDEAGCSSLNLKRWLPLGSAGSTHCDGFEIEWPMEKPFVAYCAHWTSPSW
jgi:hypothetical protein